MTTAQRVPGLVPIGIRGSTGLTGFPMVGFGRFVRFIIRQKIICPFDQCILCLQTAVIGKMIELRRRSIVINTSLHFICSF